MQQKLHQLYSGTIKFEDGTHQIIDNSKAEFIKDYFKGKKIAIYYNFIAEFELLKNTFDLAIDLNDFNNSEKNIALQFVSGREGISLAKADYIVMFNIQFSAVTYWQARDRLTTMNRLSNEIFWIFSKDGIERKIYETVKKKENYTLENFKKDYGK